MSDSELEWTPLMFELPNVPGRHTETAKGKVDITSLTKNKSVKEKKINLKI